MRRSLLAALLATAFVALVVAGGCAPKARVPEPDGVPVQTAQVSLFYSTGRSLFEERRLVDKTDVYQATLKELMLASPESNTDLAIVQPIAEVRSAVLEDGVLTVDWDAAVLDFEADPEEKQLALAAVLRTIGEFPEVDKVRFTVEGRTEGDLDGKDVEAFWGDVSLKGQPWPVLRAVESEAEPATATP